MLRCLSMCRDQRPPHIPVAGFCDEKRQLVDAFLEAIHELNALQTQQIQAVINGDSDFSRFDVLLHIAQQKKDRAKYAWISHVETHHCEE
jgi:hypothetical protein